MTTRDPRQILIILDVRSGTPVDEIIGRLPEGPQGEASSPELYRLSDSGLTPWPTHRDPNRADWQAWARAVEQLVDRVRRHEKANQPVDLAVDLFIAGDAPAPLFVQLGQALASWPRPLRFFDRRSGRQTWEEVLIDPAALLSPLPQSRLPQRYFDQRQGHDDPEHLTSSPHVAVVISDRGSPVEPSSVSHYWQEVLPGQPEPPCIEFITSKFRSLVTSNVKQAGSELAQWFRQKLAPVAPTIQPTLFIAGTPLLAFVSGLALGPTRVSIAWFDRHAYHSALHLPLPPLVATAERERIQVCLAYAPPTGKETRLHQELANHLRASSSTLPFDLVPVDLHDEVPGHDRAEQHRRILRDSDIVVVFLSSEFLVSPLAELIEPRSTQERAVIPLLERAGGDVGPWRDIAILPRDKRPLRGRTNRDTIWKDLAREVCDRARPIAETKISQRIADSAFRSPPSPSTTQQATTIAEYLDALERDLAQIPRLRCTAERRYSAWYGLCDFADRLWPAKKNQEQLQANTRDWTEAIHRTDPTWPVPDTYGPDDPLGFFLDQLEPKDAARWLCLGIVEVVPKLPFPQWREEQDLIAHIELLKSHLSESQQRWIETVLYLHSSDCPSLLAGLSRLHVPPRPELERAVALLTAFRSGDVLPELNDDLSVIHSVTLLNVIAAQAWFRNDLSLAQNAYLAAQQRAQVDGNTLGEWVAVMGLRMLSRSHQVGRPSAQAAVADSAHWKMRQDQLADQAEVALFREAVQGAHSRTQAGLLDAMQRALTPGSAGYHASSWPDQIRSLLSDQEELGQPPTIAGGTAALLIRAGFFAPSTSFGSSAIEAVTLLCRYGVSGETEKNVFSPDLNPQQPDFADLCALVLRPGRTNGEWLAREAFLRTYLPDLPLSQADKAQQFFRQVFEQLPLFGDDWIRSLHGSSYGSSAPDEVLRSLMEQLLFFVGHDPDRGDFAVDLFSSLHPRGQVAFLSYLHLLADLQWFDRLPDTSAIPVQLAQHLQDFWASDMGRDLLGEAISLPLRLRPNEYLIPIGLAGLLRTLKRTSAAPTLHRSLQVTLCDLLLAGLKRDARRFVPAALNQQVLRALNEAAPIVGEQPHSLLDRVIESLLQKIETDEPWDEAELLSLLAINRALLQPAQTERLWHVLLRQQDRLREMVGEPGVARPLLWIAAALRHQERPDLRELGTALLTQCPADPFALVAAVSIPSADLDAHGAVLDQAVRHCLRGQPREKMPWFASDSPVGTQRFFDESIELHGLNAVNNHLYFHPHRPLPQRWLSLAISHCYSRDEETIQGALHVLDLALRHQPQQVSGDVALPALSSVLKQGPLRTRDHALLILARYRNFFASTDREGIEEVLAAFDPPRTLGARWALQVAVLPDRTE